MKHFHENMLEYGQQYTSADCICLVTMVTKTLLNYFQVSQNLHIETFYGEKRSFEQNLKTEVLENIERKVSRVHGQLVNFIGMSYSIVP